MVECLAYNEEGSGSSSLLFNNCFLNFDVCFLLIKIKKIWIIKLLILYCTKNNLNISKQHISPII